MWSGLRETLMPGLAACLAEFSTAALYNALSFCDGLCDGSGAMFSQDDEGQQGLVLVVVLGLAAFVIALVVGVCMHRLSRSVPPVAAATTKVPMAAPVSEAPSVPPVQTVPAVAATASAASSAHTNQVSQAAADAASVKVEQGAVRFYFASGDAELAAGAADALGEVVKAAKGGRTLVITGFHDATGDAQKNAALARQRAVAVREALKQAGVSERQIVLKKPEQLVGGGSDAEARRVEITLQ
jgi:outer membrane protein OmpA-like peptidoglycan-associated protein